MTEQFSELPTREAFQFAAKLGALGTALASPVVDVTKDLMLHPKVDLGRTVATHIGNMPYSVGIAFGARVLQSGASHLDLPPEIEKKVQELISILGIISVVTANLASEIIPEITRAKGNPELLGDIAFGLIGYALMWYGTSYNEKEKGILYEKARSTVINLVQKIRS